jgi:hypothetical protein
MLSKNALPQIACWGGRFYLLLAGRHGLFGKHFARIAMPLRQSTRTPDLLAGRVDGAPSS